MRKWLERVVIEMAEATAPVANLLHVGVLVYLIGSWLGIWPEAWIIIRSPE